MADDRNSYKGSAITLELHEDDMSGGVSPNYPVRVIIFQDKEVCYSTTSITPLLLPSNGWSIALNTDQVLYTGTYHDRWILDDGTWVEKTLTISEPATTIPSKSTGGYTYFSKDLVWVVQSDGDLYRIYNNSCVAAKIEAVIMTVKGSLFNEPDYGTNLFRYLFSMNPYVGDQIGLEVETQLSMQIPNIKIDKVAVNKVDNNTYNVSVDFYNTSATNPNELLNMNNLVSVESLTSGYGSL